MKFALVLALFGSLHLWPTDSPVLPSPPEPVAEFSPENFRAECVSLVELYDEYTELLERVAKVTK